MMVIALIPSVWPLCLTPLQPRHSSSVMNMTAIPASIFFMPMTLECLRQFSLMFLSKSTLAQLTVHSNVGSLYGGAVG